MKKVLFILTLSTSALLFMNFNFPEKGISGTSANPTAIEIPDDVQAIIDNSCYGCHSSESKNMKGKNKLNFDKLNDIKTYKAIGKLTDIAETVIENDMPPKKFLKKYPERALTDEQKELLANWAGEAAKSLAGE